MRIDKIFWDDHKDDYLPRLQKSYIYKQLVSRCGEEDSEVVSLCHEAIHYSAQRTKTIVRHMNEYTLHDSDHLFRVLNLMERLLGKTNIENLSIPELQLLVLSCFFHDIGMAPSEREVLNWKKIWDENPDFETESDRESYNHFKRFYSARPEQEEIIRQLLSERQDSKADVIKSYLITEFIRQTHAERARQIIDKDWNGRIVYRNTDLTVELANICHSHNEDPLKLLDMDKGHPCGNAYVTLPLIGVILRLADILDFDGKRTPPILYSHLYVRHPVSIKEWQKHRAVENWDIGPELIQFSAKCTHPAIEAAIHEFCDLIDKELSVSNNVVSIVNDFNSGKFKNVFIKIPFKVSREKIETKKDIYNKPIYTYKDTKFNLSKRQVIDLLMGTKLYGNPEIALRELVQNSIDACLLRMAQEEKWGLPYTPEIHIKYYKEGNDDVLEVNDNGTGMDQYIIDKYYSKVGSSFYKSLDFYTLRAESNASFMPTSRFGIGILSCFMVADTLVVDTKKIYGPHRSSEAINLTVEGQESIFWIKPGGREHVGTTTKLLLRKQKNPWNNMGEDQFVRSVENIIPNPPFKISIVTLTHETVRDHSSFSKISASSLKDYTWKDHENIKAFELTLNKPTSGIIGSVVVAILQSKKKPVSNVKLNSREVEVDGQTFSLERELALYDNSIREISKTLTVNDEGDITEDNNTSHFAKSQSRISFHGIEIPATIFPDSWMRKPNQVSVTWPLPMLIVLDVCNNRDLDLNSARTEILLNEKWDNLEEELAFQICMLLYRKVSKDYWRNLEGLFDSKKPSTNFIRGLTRMKDIKLRATKHPK